MWNTFIWFSCKIWFAILVGNKTIKQCSLQLLVSFLVSYYHLLLLVSLMAILFLFYYFWYFEILYCISMCVPFDQVNAWWSFSFLENFPIMHLFFFFFIVGIDALFFSYHIFISLCLAQLSKRCVWYFSFKLLIFSCFIYGIYNLWKLFINLYYPSKISHSHFIDNIYFYFSRIWIIVCIYLS